MTDTKQPNETPDRPAGRSGPPDGDRQAARAHVGAPVPPARAGQAGRRRPGPEGTRRHGHDLAAPADHRVHGGGPHERLPPAHGPVHERPARGPRQRQRHSGGGQGAVVLPGAPGAPRLLPPDGRRRPRPDLRAGGRGPDPVHRPRRTSWRPGRRTARPPSCCSRCSPASACSSPSSGSSSAVPATRSSSRTSSSSRSGRRAFTSPSDPKESGVMSNYQVEPANKPQALTTEALKARPPRAGAGHLAPGAAAGIAGRGHGPVAPRGHRRHHRLPVAQPRGPVRRRRRDRHARRPSRPTTLRCRSPRASRPTSPVPRRSSCSSTRTSSSSSRARTTRATARSSTSARSTSAARTLAASQTRARRTSGWSARATGPATTASASRPTAPQYGPAPRGMDRFGVKVDADGVLTINTGKITLGPLPVARRPAGDRSRRARPPAASDPVTAPPARPPRRPMTDQPGRPPEERLPAPRPSSAPVPAERFSAPPSAHRNDLTPERAGADRPPVRERAMGGLPGRDDRRAVRHRLLLLRDSACRAGSRRRAWTRPRTSSRSSPWSAATTCTRPTARSATACKGEGGAGPILNRQDKLFAHLNPDYLRNILEVGGRYACGNADTHHARVVQHGEPARARSTTSRSTT